MSDINSDAAIRYTVRMSDTLESGSISPAQYEADKSSFLSRLLSDGVSSFNIEHNNGSVLTVSKLDSLFSVGIIDEPNGCIYYYNNGQVNEDAVVLHGETYPYYMISDDAETVKEITDAFILTGAPSESVNWIEEDM